MSNATAMRSLGEDMARAQAERVTAQEERVRQVQELAREVQGLQRQTAELLGDIERGHRDMRSRLMSDLSASTQKRQVGEEGRKSDARRASRARVDAIAKLGNQVAKLRKKTTGLVDGLGKARSEMAEELETRSAQAREDRVDGEKARRNRAEEERRSRVEDIGRLRERVAELQQATADLLRHLDQAHSEMSAQLGAALSEAGARRTSNEASRRRQARADAEARSEAFSGIKAAVQQTRSDAHSILDEARQLLDRMRRDSAEAAAAWKELVASMHGRVAVSPEAPVAEEELPEEPPEAAEEAPAGVAEAEEPPAGIPVQEAEPEAARDLAAEEMTLNDRIIQLITDSGTGLKLTQIAEALGEARVKIGNITRMLVDEGKLHKEGLYYYPVE